MGAGSSTTAIRQSRQDVRAETRRTGQRRNTIHNRQARVPDGRHDARRPRRVLDGLHRIYGEMPGIEAVPVSGTPDDVIRGYAR